MAKIQRGEENAETSALTFDEVFWAIKKHNLELAFAACQVLLNFPNMEIIPVDRELSTSALVLIKENHIAPRDAIHAATAITEKVDFIVSTDRHFGPVKGLKWKDL